ncbi:hypothetical protein [Wenyingzhuangia sp. 2_MG-2023]|uniref:hypothetical protein n=1 Tax=Wenyingzhuangia sp. 2_MG-2023 TaxID=3062639 RepID=UPI0026E2AAA2|nr:hypothetical protein [Wenyingzhuangia sp. 2_MG-2023]MDO6737102.1 hypothetical protein [Wenyingzhuangia sp. 2_MG-2023]
MKCHYIQDEIAGKVLIPGCWGTVHSNDMSDCYCDRSKKSPEQVIEDLKEQVKKLKKQLNEKTTNMQ